MARGTSDRHDNETRDYEVVVDSDRLDEVVDALLQTDRYAIDTEFHRERTYYPHLALVQIAWDDELVLIDPLAVSIEPLAAVFETEIEAVIHASSQDLEVLQLVCGVAPRRLFDTQIAAAFVGMRTPSLAALHDQLLGLRLAKANRLTDWLRRPLEPGQLAYAASDVERLLDIQDELVSRLQDRSRLAWAEAEFEIARTRTATARNPEDAWKRIKEARSLGGDARSRARALAAWRERTAQDRDVPIRHVLPDLAIVALAQRPPKSPEEVTKTRGLERRGLAKADAKELIRVLEDSAGDEPPPSQSRRAPAGADLRPAVTLIAAWLAQFAEDSSLDPAMVGSRADIEEFVRSGESRLSQGWRYELAGSAIEGLLAGKAALAFDGGGRVTVEQRSYQPLPPAG